MQYFSGEAYNSLKNAGEIMMEQNKIFGNNPNEKKIGLVNYNFDVDFQPRMTRFELEELQEELRIVREEYERKNRKFVSEENQRLMWR